MNQVNATLVEFKSGQQQEEAERLVKLDMKEEESSGRVNGEW